MGVTARVAGALAGAAGLAAAGGAVRVVQRRRTISRRAGETTPFGSLRSPGRTVVAEDGVPLHVEVDEADSDITIVFAHGYALNLDCWHFQRAAFRGLVRTVFYDQRSHGRSGRGDIKDGTIDRLGRDLKAVIDAVVPDGPVVLVGHSMGGMTLVSFAEQYPELLGTKVIGAALISTTAGGLDPARLFFPIVPVRLSSGLTNGTIRTLARGHRAVDGVRRLGRTIATVTTDAFAFGDAVPAAYVEFVDDMLSATPFQVVAEFFPGFKEFDRFDEVGNLSAIPTTIICGTADKLTSIGHSRKLHSRIAGSTLIECPGAGHMVILERHGQVNAALDQLLSAARVAQR
ncbi:alpha/beta hydrolase [Nocardioides sp.]|uniref:alpha/beta fold hydrolase n=1 Tax=Nocardioides sp. TaxID=35761 RepID=UPI002633F3D8|nr:alpha/beta hydrolase [Nocardioides sp.]